MRRLLIIFPNNVTQNAPAKHRVKLNIRLPVLKNKLHRSFKISHIYYLFNCDSPKIILDNNSKKKKTNACARTEAIKSKKAKFYAS